jgi:uncharacterized protein YecE (DUF72 family)
MTVRIGTAGWSIPKSCVSRFPATGSVLERYAQRLDIVEINSSFYRPHRRTTYERWAASTPSSFVFSVKLPKTITHDRRLRDVADPLDRFLDEVSGLGGKLKTLLVQLPPSLEFSTALAGDFFDRLRWSFGGAVAVEARHDGWFTQEAAAVLSKARIDLVAADPPPRRGVPKWDSIPNPVYIRLHGSPKIYFSNYSEDVLVRLAQRLVASSAPAPVCIFDNTAAGLATDNALSLTHLLAAMADQH